MATKLFLASKIFFIVVSCFLTHNIVATTTTLNQGKSLNTTTTIVSHNGLFTLGFQRLGTTKLNSSYLTIWYDGDASAPLWIANRERPISDDSGDLVFNAYGNLRIVHSGGDPITLFAGRPTISNLVVILEDTGNLVLKESTASTNQALWQSFDLPSDSFLPGMKLGTNSSTGQNWQLTSWAGVSMPTTGSFTLEWNVQAGLVLKMHGIIYWSSGKLLDNKRFEHFDLSSNLVDVIYTNFSDADGSYFSYSIQRSNSTPQHHKDFSFLRLWYDGSLIDNRTSAYGFHLETCDGNTTQNGCVRWEGPKCRGWGVRYEHRIGWFLDTAPKAIDANVSLVVGDCEKICWMDCRCIATTTYNDDETGCIFFYGGFNPNLQGRSIIVVRYLIGFEDESHSGRTTIWILIVVSFLLIVVITGILLYVRGRRMKVKRLNKFFKLDSKNNGPELEAEDLKVYSPQSLLIATNGFSIQNKLGQGGFGPVYKGTLPDGREVAVKKLSGISRQGLAEFKSELIIIAKLQHSNLVRLFGCCIEGEEKMLVYEYMPNKSLDSFIFDPSKKMKLDWTKRYNIIKGISQGMFYMHNLSRIKVVHRDLKTSNILLDHDLNPKISDFGMAKIFKNNQLEAHTNHIAGTYGYMSPEYAKKGIFSEKSDVFGFGVIVLEMISGIKNYSLVQVDPPLNLVGFAWELWKEGRQLELLDPPLRDSRSNEQVLACIQIGLLCVEENAFDRPTMPNVVSMLSCTMDVSRLPSPKQPAFSLARQQRDRILMDSRAANAEPQSFSLNPADLSDLSAR